MVYSLMAAEDFYQEHFLTEEGLLQASYPVPGGRHNDTFNITQFCFVHLQVGVLHLCLQTLTPGR